jgi:hypothetical protein
MSDPASLQNLHDIVTPGPVGWWPLAPGWYVAAAVALGAILWLAWRMWKRWRRNRYRGQALRELARIRRGDGREGLSALPVLLKRAALSAWPRETVAALVGLDWHRFLDETAGGDRFCSGAGRVLDRLAYTVPGAGTPTAEESRAVLDAAEFWLKRHRAPEATD